MKIIITLIHYFFLPPQSNVTLVIFGRNPAISTQANSTLDNAP